MSEQPLIAIRGVNKWFGDLHVLRDINLEIEAVKKAATVAA